MIEGEKIPLGMIHDIINKVKEKGKTAQSLNTGLVGENIFIASFEMLPLEKLESMRFIINKIIKDKKIQQKMNEKKHALSLLVQQKMNEKRAETKK